MKSLGAIYWLVRFSNWLEMQYGLGNLTIYIDQPWQILGSFDLCMKYCYWLQIENEACLASKKKRLRYALLKICKHVCNISFASFCASQHYISKYYIARLQFWGNRQSTCNQKGLKRFGNAHALRKRGDVRHIVLGKVVQIHDDASQVELHSHRQEGPVRLQSWMRVCMHWKAMHCN